jgi:hypothetical protein
MFLQPVSARLGQHQGEHTKYKVEITYFYTKITALSQLTY